MGTLESNDTAFFLAALAGIQPITIPHEDAMREPLERKAREQLDQIGLEICKADIATGHEELSQALLKKTQEIRWSANGNKIIREALDHIMDRQAFWEGLKGAPSLIPGFVDLG